MGKLTAKRQRFVEEYICDMNATQAAIRAGYSEHTAGSIGNEILQIPDVAAAIVEARVKQSERTGITSDMVLAGLLKETKGDQHAARITAWSWIGRHLAMFTDKVQHDGAVPTISISVRPEGEPVNRLAHLTNGDSP